MFFETTKPALNPAKEQHATTAPTTQLSPIGIDPLSPGGQARKNNVPPFPSTDPFALHEPMHPKRT